MISLSRKHEMGSLSVKSSHKSSPADLRQKASLTECAVELQSRKGKTVRVCVRAGVCMCVAKQFGHCLRLNVTFESHKPTHNNNNRSIIKMKWNSFQHYCYGFFSLIPEFKIDASSSQAGFSFLFCVSLDSEIKTPHLEQQQKQQQQEEWTGNEDKYEKRRLIYRISARQNPNRF